MLYSISGMAKAVQGGKAPPKVLSTAGAVRWHRYAALRDALGNLTAAESGSVFGETAAAALQHANLDMETLGKVLDDTTLPGQGNASTRFNSRNPLAAQLEVVSKVIKARVELRGERTSSLSRWAAGTRTSTRWPGWRS